MSQKRNGSNGPNAIEYGLIAALLALAITAAAMHFSDGTKTTPAATSEQTK